MRKIPCKCHGSVNDTKPKFGHSKCGAYTETIYVYNISMHCLSTTHAIGYTNCRLTIRVVGCNLLHAKNSTRALPQMSHLV
jgi:hypothetical protein